MWRNINFEINKALASVIIETVGKIVSLIFSFLKNEIVALDGDVANNKFIPVNKGMGVNSK